MRITSKQLRQIIREELGRMSEMIRYDEFGEPYDDGMGHYDDDDDDFGDDDDLDSDVGYDAAVDRDVMAGNYGRRRVRESRYGKGRHGTDWGYGSYGGGSQGGRDEGWDEPEEGGWGSGPSARDLGWKVGDTVKSGGKTGTVTKVSEWDTGVSVEWDDGSKGEYDGKYMKKGR